MLINDSNPLVPDKVYSNKTVLPVGALRTTHVARYSIPNYGNESLTKIVPNSTSPDLQKVLALILEEVVALQYSPKNKDRLEEIEKDLKQAQKLLQLILNKLRPAQVKPATSSNLYDLLCRALGTR
jgi:hypothetical protein